MSIYMSIPSVPVGRNEYICEYINESSRPSLLLGGGGLCVWVCWIGRNRYGNMCVNIYIYVNREGGVNVEIWGGLCVVGRLILAASQPMSRLYARACGV